MSNPTDRSEVWSPETEQLCRRPFLEPEVSSPVDVVAGNPAADAFFAVIASSGGGTP